MKLSVCTDAVFAGIDTVSAMKQIHDAGFQAFEFWGWENKDIAAIDQARQELGMKVAAFCTRMVSLTDAGQRDDYLQGLKDSLAVAGRLDCRQLITQVGNHVEPGTNEEHQSIVDGLKCCVPFLEEAGVTLLIEPLNTRIDHPGYYLTSSDEAARIINEVSSPSVQLLFDFYHQQITEGDILRRSTELLPCIGHFHAAGNPGRNELTRGEIQYTYIFEQIEKLGYQGYIGLEYSPLEDPAAGLCALRQYI